MKNHPCLLLAGLLLMTPNSPTFANNDHWGLEPLAKAVEVTPTGPPEIKQNIKSRFQSLPADTSPIPLYRDGQPQFLIVTPENSTKAENTAAKLLAETFQKMTGTRPIILTEEKVRVKNENSSVVVDTQGREWASALWLGATAQAKKQGISAENLPPEGYRLRSLGTWLFIVGNDTSPSGNPLNSVYFGAASLLERHFGVRWLWPGDLGTVIPQHKNVEIAGINEQDEPAMIQRMIRNTTEINDRNRIGLKLLGGTKNEDAIFLNAQEERGEWLRNHGAGGTAKNSGSIILNYRHAYSDWYEKYGEAHPEWFALQPNGTRKQTTERPRLCKSNPDVARQRAAEIVEAAKADAKADSFSISPNDGSGHDHFCMCQECRKLDPPNGRKRQFMFSKNGQRFYENYVSLSDRVVAFYNRIAEEVARTHPKLTLGAYAYSAYRDAPLRETLHPSVLIGFVGLDYFDEATRQSDLKAWNEWVRRTSRPPFLRPNALGRGNSLPAVYVHKLADDIRHCHQTGMVIVDFDSLNGDWSTQGLNYYILAKLLWDPSRDVDEMVRDYCLAGFGNSADKMQEYFTQIENAVSRVAARDLPSIEGELRDEEQNDPEMQTNEQRAQNFEDAYFAVFSKEFSKHLRSLLHEASEQAESETIRARIAFQESALDYLDLYQAMRDGKESIESRKDMLAWFRKVFHEHPHTINAPGRLWRTSRTYRGIEKVTK